jgi:ubiquitin C-terminal hydrolase
MSLFNSPSPEYETEKVFPSDHITPEIDFQSGVVDGEQLESVVQATIPPPPLETPRRGNWLIRRMTSQSSTGSRKKRPGGVGLANIGNTCFMNATLQCLSSTPILRNFFTSTDFRRTRLAGEFAKLLSQMTKSSRAAIKPKKFKKALELHAPMFSGDDHQDAHELLAVLLDGLHEELNRGSQSERAGEGPVSDGSVEWERHRAENCSVIAEVFDGQQRVTAECQNCQNQSVAFEPFRYLMLPVPASDHRLVHVHYVPGDGERVRVSMTVRNEMTAGDILEILGREGFAVGNCLVAEVSGNRIIRLVDKFEILNEFVIFEMINSNYSNFCQIVHRRESPAGEWENFFSPSIIPVNPGWGKNQLRREIQSHVKRLVHPSAPRTPYSLRIISSDGIGCGVCSRPGCRGCPLTSLRSGMNWTHIAVDWKSKIYLNPAANSVAVRHLPDSAPPTARARPALTLYDCLDAYTQRELLAGDNRIDCDSCHSRSDAVRKIDFSRSPDVLVILLKRFQFSGGGFERVPVPVEFSETNFTIRAADSEEVYDLYGVVNHTGSLSSGHYTALCRDGDSGEWFLYNDHSVTAAGEVDIGGCGKSCYVLFYRRKSSRKYVMT